MRIIIKLIPWNDNYLKSYEKKYKLIGALLSVESNYNK